ncbi:MAG: hypothetical protein RIB65_21880 [Ilumatobacter fluminis]|uniref:hypothetical protein n=1 Tax=Ilumatobacter fluminis TaxID=467091 RepID=UPI0032EDE91A
MSRASSYRNAAVDLRRASTGFTDVANAHRRLDATMIGALGPVATIHDASVDAVGTHLALAADEATELAAECDRRAAVCEAYDHEVMVWRSLPLILRLSTPHPIPPARWVTG